MPDTATNPPLRQAIVARTKPVPERKPTQVKGKLVIALKEIVWHGAELAEAAKVAGLTTHAVRCALDRPHVIRFLKRQRDLFRSFVAAQNIHHARRLRDKSTNAMARLGAIRYLDGAADEQAAASGPVRPGVVIVIGDGPRPRELPRPAPVVDVTPAPAPRIVRD
jgi:hypothetical protein